MSNKPAFILRGGVEGQFRLTILNADRSVRLRTRWIRNLVTNLGLDRCAQTNALASFCRIGSGTNAAAATDTALQTHVAATSTVVGGTSTVNNGAPNYETISTSTYEFEVGTVVGNMAEVGLAWSSSAANQLFSRARIVDGGGNPTTITVLAAEILQVTYRLALFPTLTDVAGTVDISGVTYNYVARLARAATATGLTRTAEGLVTTVRSVIAYTGVLGAITAFPTGTTSNLTAGSFSAYVDGNFYRDFTITAGLTVGNLAGGIGCIEVRTGANLADNFIAQIEFTPKIPKTATNTLSITWRQAWARRP